MATPVLGFPGKTTTPTGTKDAYSNLPVDQRNAYLGLKNQLDQFGLGSLAHALLNFVQQGYESDSLAYLISQTPEYQKRFSGNQVRIKNGLAALSPSEYLATERAYRSVLASANLPNNFYDKPEDFNNLIGADISPQELQERADHAYRYAQSVDPAIRQQFKTYYGIDEGHLAAYFLDPKKAQNLLNKQAMAAEIGGIASEQGLNINRTKAESYYDMGVDADKARTGAQNAALVAPETTTLGLRFGTSYDANDAADEFIGNLASARRKRETLAQSEQALFSGDVQEARAFGTDTTGSY